MANSSGTLSGLHWLTGAAIGALAMYAFDPQRGRRRRAIARDKTLSLATHAGGFLRRAGRDLQGRMHGWQAQAQRWSRDEGIPDDLKLIERVRSRLGRVCSHPHAIQVGANQGRVTLSGPIVAREVARVLAATRSTPGVGAVEDRLIMHENAQSISSLQGGVPRSRAHFELLQDHWSPALRVAAVVAGATLALAGLRRGGAIGAACVGVGALAVARGTVNHPAATLRTLLRDARAGRIGPVAESSSPSSPDSALHDRSVH